MATNLDLEEKAKPTLENENFLFYIDYPPTYNEYNKQLVERDLDNALSCIFRSFYGARTLLPEVPGLFVDIERYTHIIDTLSNRLAINAEINAIVWRICGDLSPQVNVEYNRLTQQMTYWISMRGNFLLKVDQANNLETAEILYNGKKFYE